MEGSTVPMTERIPPLPAEVRGNWCLSHARREKLIVRNAQPREFLRTIRNLFSLLLSFRCTKCPKSNRSERRSPRAFCCKWLWWAKPVLNQRPPDCMLWPWLGVHSSPLQNKLSYQVVSAFTLQLAPFHLKSFWKLLCTRMHQKYTSIGDHSTNDSYEFSGTTPSRHHSRPDSGGAAWAPSSLPLSQLGI